MNNMKGGNLKLQFERAVREFSKPTHLQIAERLKRMAEIILLDEVAGLEVALNHLEEIREDINLIISNESLSAEPEMAQNEKLPAPEVQP